MQRQRRPVSPHVEEYAQQRKGEEAEHLRRQMKNLPLQERKEHTMTFAATAATGVQHGLGRTPKGWLVVDLAANLTLYRRTTDPWDSNTATLYNASANAGNAKVWFF